MNCRYCGYPVQPCTVKCCTGWAATNEGCRGYMHSDLFHGCTDGQHQADVRVTQAVASAGPGRT